MAIVAGAARDAKVLTVILLLRGGRQGTGDEGQQSAGGETEGDPDTVHHRPSARWKSLTAFMNSSGLTVPSVGKDAVIAWIAAIVACDCDSSM